MMTWWETFRIAVAAIVAHRVRSALTTLGITIGIAAVTLSVGLAQGASASVSASINSLGSNMLTVQGGYYSGPSDGMIDTSTMVPLSLADADALADRDAAPDIAGVAPVIQTGFELATPDNAVNTMAEATTADWLSVRSRSLLMGTFFTQAQYDDAEPVVVLGSSTATQLFGDASAAVGALVTASGNSFRVVGVLGAAGGMMDSDDMVVLPMTTYLQRLSYGNEEPSAIYLAATSDTRLTQAYQEAEALLLARRGATDINAAGIMIMSQQSLQDAMAAVTNTLTLLLGGIAAISLVVGGIGVMNIMFITVRERTREIGIRAATGASMRDILTQFLTEAVVLSTLGGIAGLALAGGVGAVAAWGFGMPVVFSVTVALGALAGATLMGAGFGLVPAIRAARLSPVEALASP